MVALDTAQTALATFDATGLLEFTMQLLDLPADGTRFTCSVGGEASFVVGNDKIRPVGGDRQAEQPQHIIFGKPLQFDALALLFLR